VILSIDFFIDEMANFPRGSETWNQKLYYYPCA